MGDIMSVYKVYPEEVDSLESIKKSLEEKVTDPFKLADVKEEPIAFGLKLLKVSVIYPEKVDGLLDKIEDTLKSIEGVRDIEVEASTLI